MKIPAVMRLIKIIRTIYRTKVPFSKKNVMIRDGFICQYCGKLKELTIDHVTPVSRGGKSIFEKCDVKIKENVKKSVDLTYKTYGKIDIAILAAGILTPNPLQKYDSNIIKESIEINFLGNVYFIEYLLNKMKKQKSGTIAVTSTLPDKRGVPGWGAYGASKAALSWFLESLRAEAKKDYNINRFFHNNFIANSSY